MNTNESHREIHHLEKVAQTVRHHILVSTTEAGSGHPSSSLSAVEAMVTLMFGGYFKFETANPDNKNNDRLIFSKGHAAPLLYSLWAVAGGLPYDELKTLRKFGSRLEGHPVKEFPYTEVATGSLGQGLSVGVGMALNALYIDKLPYRTFVLLGDSEMAEGSNWEAMQIAAHYKLHNLVGILDMNRLGQRGETMYGYDDQSFKKKCESFGWAVEVVDGHDVSAILDVFSRVLHRNIDGDTRPAMIIAKTVKGKGVSLMEDKEGWHGKVLSRDQMQEALDEINRDELGAIDIHLKADIPLPESITVDERVPTEPVELDTSYDEPLATRKAYGHALVELFPKYPDIVVLDAEVSNSTYAEMFKKEHPDRFFEMFLTEQNMVGVALGLALRGKTPFVSTFASFFTRAADQIRIAQYSGTHVNFVGSHSGVSIGEDGASQMGLEDISLFRSVLGSVVLYPADHVSDEKCIELMIQHRGIVYLRTTRMDTEPLYSMNENFKIGGSKSLKISPNDAVTIVAAGITLYEALKAHDLLKNEGINARVIDAYCIKPIDQFALERAARETKAIITVEDHFAEGGLGEAVMSAIAQVPVPVYSLAVRKMPRSGSPEELLDYEEISTPHIVEKIKDILDKGVG